MNNNLPITATFLEALSFPYKHYRMLLKVGLPLIITGGLLLTLNYFFPNIAGIDWFSLTLSHFFSNTEWDAIQVFSIVMDILFLLSLVMAIVGCHRIFLLESNIVEESNLFTWTGNEIKYIGWLIFIGLCTFLVSIPFTFILIPFMLSSYEIFFENQFVVFAVIALFNIPIYYIASRWSLVLPSSAIGIHGKSLTWSWELSSNNGWRLTLLIGFLPFIIDIIFSLLPTYDSILFNLLQEALWLIVGVIEIGLLSLSYNFLVNNESSD